MMLLYEKIYNQHIKYIDYKEIWEEKYKIAWQEEYKKMFPKAKNIDYKKFPPEWIEEFNKDWKPLGVKLTEAYDIRKKLLNDLLNKIGNEENIDVIVDTELHKLYSVGTDVYRSQPACHSYTMGDVKMEQSWLSSIGIQELKCEITDNTKTSTGSFGAYVHGQIELWANIKEWQYDYLKRHVSFNILDWCVQCWGNGINPKVRMPFLNDELYEKSMRIHMGKE